MSTGVDDAAPGITYDDTVYEIIVTVTDDGSGKLKAAINVDGEANSHGIQL
ncbi:MAG: hypothetical protein IKG91_05265 [Firmicutes bacterium]|nr:hypothetical protein [Bacillota bacterium]